MSARLRAILLTSLLAAGAASLTLVPDAQAHWVRFGFPGVVVVPPPVYAPPPPAYYYAPRVAYGPPHRFWVPGHYRGPYWIAGHWAWR